MRVNVDLTLIKPADTIIVANNRQALALKKSLADSNHGLRISKVYSYQSFLDKCWKSRQINQEKRLLNQLEFRILLMNLSEEVSVKNPETFIEELIKCYKLCKTYGIEINKISDLLSIPSKLFVRLIREYEKFKVQNNCIDQTDIFKLIIDHLGQINSGKVNYFSFGFNEPTPEQNKLFETLNCKPLFSKQLESNSDNFAFMDQESELRAIVKWAKKTSGNYPEKQIGIVVPNLNELQHKVKSTFDLEFASSLLEVHKKPYNISLGISLSEYPLIKHLISILRLSDQYVNGNVETEILKKVTTSPYISGAISEQNNRALINNKILQLSKTKIINNEIISFCKDCPLLKEIFLKLNRVKFSKKITLEQSLDLMNSFMLIWGFTSDRNLSSSEYQVYEKYQVESLVLNKLSNFHNLNTFSDTLKILIAHLNAVIFQPQSGPANIHILGSLEAEGLFFDFAWVSSMTSSFLPGKIKMPLFIPPKTSIENSLPGTSFELITKESKSTLKNLKNLSKNLIFSYSTTSDSREQLPTPYLLFKDSTQIQDLRLIPREMELIEDFNAPKIKNLEIKKGVKSLQDQMGCQFKGFANRLNFTESSDPSIGLSKLEQGNIIHNILDRFFNEVQSSSDLKQLSDNTLDDLIDAHSETALREIPESNFKNNEKERVKRVIKKYIDLEKDREFFEVIKTESETKVEIDGLKFSTRIDRMDRLKDGSKLIIDYKTGKNIGLSKLINQPLEQAQLPIYAITNEVSGVAFATINPQNCQFKAITKNKHDLPMSSQSINRMPEWKKQVSDWKEELVKASQQFQNGNAKVLPSLHACDFCDYDLLCRIDKSAND